MLENSNTSHENEIDRADIPSDEVSENILVFFCHGGPIFGGGMAKNLGSGQF